MSHQILFRWKPPTSQYSFRLNIKQNTDKRLHCAHSVSIDTYRLNGDICSSRCGLHTQGLEGARSRKVEAVFGLAELFPKVILAGDTRL